MSSNAALRVVGIVKRYAPDVSVGPITFDVHAGEYLSLLGPSGCGKTTTLRCIAGFETLSDGAIYLGDERLDQRPAHRRGVGLVFQNYALFPHLSVYDNVAFGLRLAKMERKDIDRRVGAMLDIVDLAGMADRFPNQLSGGQQQRVAIARAVVMEPRVILFDEPLSNLDLKLRIQMRRELRDLQRRLGKTTIYVTHDQTEALALSDRIAVLSHGKIEQIGTPKEVYERPATRFVAEFIGSTNLLHGVVSVSSGGGTLVETDRGLRLKAEMNGFDVGARVLVLLRPERLQLTQPEPFITEPDNRFEAQVTDVTYLGEDLTFAVRGPGNLELTAAAKTSHRTRGLCAGNSVSMSIAASDVHLLRP